MRTSERDIFEAALGIPDDGARSVYLRQACGDDDRLREHVRGLLMAQRRLGDFLAAPLPDCPPTMSMPAHATSAEGPGTVIGSYRLLESMSAGGMGVVYLVEQAVPVQRKVVLKIIKPDMDTSEVIARFEAERQTLALMDHPNIAHIFDGGTTQFGRPYFVMESVPGVPITEYCDTHNLPLRERLQLFVTVFHAVQHAHQKGIVHRDIKPSNVLVTQQDGRAVPKVIDFGVTKALGGPLTDRTLLTHAACPVKNGHASPNTPRVYLGRRPLGVSVSGLRNRHTRSRSASRVENPGVPPAGPRHWKPTRAGTIP